ncbi:MAG: hypothetical protein FJW26_11925 [Acidimicrobiia bacterium]|nr:hypothetical protein [Acidimicrobiia bacterium]
MTDCALASRRRQTCSGIASVVAAAIVMASVGWTQQSGAKAARRTQNAFVESQKPVVFEADILPMLQSRCLSCHSQSQALGGVVLESVEAIRSGRGGKRIVVAGKSDASPLFQVAARRRQPFMPPAGNGAVRLTPQELSLLKQWIDQGALTNPGTKASDRFAWQNLPATVTPVYSVAITRDGAFAACGRANQLWIYHLASGRVVARLVDPSLRLVNPEPDAAHRDLVNSLDFSPDGHLLVSGGFRTVKFWRRQTTKPTLETDSTGGETDPLPVWILERTIGNVDDVATLAGRVTALDISPDGALLATGGGVPSRGGELKIWRVSTGMLETEVSDAHSDTIVALEFSPDGQYLATGSTDRFAKVFSVKTRRMVRVFEGHTHHVLDVAWRADGKALASCGADNVVKRWDFETGEQKQTIGGYEKEVTSVSFIAESDDLLVSSGDPIVRLGERLLSGVSAFVHSAAASRDGQVAVAGDQTGRFMVWHGSSIRPLHVLGPAATARSGDVPAETRR